MINTTVLTKDEEARILAAGKERFPFLSIVKAITGTAGHFETTVVTEAGDLQVRVELQTANG